MSACVNVLGYGLFIGFAVGAVGVGFAWIASRVFRVNHD